MRKGVVLEQKLCSTVLLTREGEFVKARKLPGAEVGEEVYFEEKRVLFPAWLPSGKLSTFAIVLAVFLVFVPAYFWYGDDDIYAHVNIDINPSFEAKINRELEVTSLEALDEEAQFIVDSMEEWEGKQLTAVTAQLFEGVKGEDAGEKDYVLLGISYLSGKEDLNISENVRQFFDQDDKSYQAAVYTVPYAWKKEAEKNGKTVNALVNERITANEKVTEIEEDVQELIRTFFESKKD